MCAARRAASCKLHASAGAGGSTSAHIQRVQYESNATTRRSTRLHVTLSAYEVLLRQGPVACSL